MNNRLKVLVTAHYSKVIKECSVQKKDFNVSLNIY